MTPIALPAPAWFEGSTSRAGDGIPSFSLADLHGIASVGTSATPRTWIVRLDGNRLDAIVEERLDWLSDVEGGESVVPRAAGMDEFCSFLSRLRSLAGMPDDVLADIGEDAFALIGRRLPDADALEAVGREVRGEALDALLAADEVLARLDPRALELCAAPGVGTLRPDDYVAIDRNLDPEAPLAAAMLAHPALPMTMVSLRNAEPGRFSDAVAGRGPASLNGILKEAVEAAHGTPGAFVAAMTAAAAFARMTPEARLGARRSIGPGVYPVDDPPVTLGGMLAAFPIDRMPRDAAGWAACATCAPALRFAVRNAPPGQAAAMLDANGDWISLARRLGKATDVGTLSHAVDDIADMLRSFAARVLEPACSLAGWVLPEADGPHVAIALLLSGRRLPRILGMSRAWHVDALAMEASLPEVPGTSSGWAAGLPDAEFDGVVIRVLTTKRALLAEGMRGTDEDGVEGLAHCVGCYAGPCLDGTTRIVSLRVRDGSGSWRRLSTAEVATRSYAGFHVVQHRGHGNVDPTAEAQEALGRYMRLVAGEASTIAHQAFLPVPGLDALISDAGYDWRVPGAWDAVRDTWARFLPRDARRAGPEDFAAFATASARTPHPWRARPMPMPVSTGVCEDPDLFPSY